MKLVRTLEVLCVPLTFTVLGGLALPLSAELLRLQEREYALTQLHTTSRFALASILCGLGAGIAAVVVQWRRAGRQRWSFYGLIALMVPLSAAAVFTIEAVRPRFEGAFGHPAPKPDFASIPLWICAAAFWLPFLLLLPRRHKNQPARDSR